MRFFVIVLAIVLVEGALVAPAGCATDSQASKGAGQGAALGGLGAVAGARSDSRAKDSAATQCRHRDAIASAQDTLAATRDPKERAYALLIQSIALEDATRG